MYAFISSLHARLDRLSVLPVAFAGLLGLVVFANAMIEVSGRAAAPVAQADLTTIAASVP